MARDVVDLERRAELAENLARLRGRVAAGCAAAGRDPAEVTVIAVTKFFPATDVLHLAELGVYDIGENRDQEAAGKSAEVAAHGVRVRWHFVGQLQRNKTRSVVRYADLVHTVDSVRLTTALGRAAADLRPAPLEVLIQVSLDGAPGRGGVVAAEVPALAEAIAGAGAGPSVTAGAGAGANVIAGEPALRLRGVMAVAPPDWEPVAAFDRLADVAARLRAAYPQATLVSAGMSGDLEAALAAGATHLRIGSGLLGKRATLR